MSGPRVKLWLVYLWRRLRQQDWIDQLLDEVGQLRRDSSILTTRLQLTGQALVNAKKKLGQTWFAEGDK